MNLNDQLECETAIDCKLILVNKNNLELPFESATEEIIHSPSKDLDYIKIRRNSKSLDKKDPNNIKYKNIYSSANSELNIEYGCETKSKTSKITRILNDRNKMSNSIQKNDKIANSSNPKIIPQVKVMTPNTSNNTNYFVNENSLPVKLMKPSTEDYLLRNSVRYTITIFIYLKILFINLNL
jgi:hypothetical protein